MDLDLAQLVVKGANSQSGLSWLQWYNAHKVYHPGYDLNIGNGNQDKGKIITTPCDGEVEYISELKTNNGFGLHLVIYHPKLGAWTHYAHCDSIIIQKGKVKAGDPIAIIGNTGTTWAHCHFEVWTRGLYNIQLSRKWPKKPYEFYPVNWPKWQVAQYYIDPAVFLNDCYKLITPYMNPLDSQVSSWARDGWDWCISENIISSDALPNKPITKEEMATMLYRFYLRINRI